MEVRGPPGVTRAGWVGSATCINGMLDRAMMLLPISILKTDLYQTLILLLLLLHQTLTLCALTLFYTFKRLADS